MDGISALLKTYVSSLEESVKNRNTAVSPQQARQWATVIASHHVLDDLGTETKNVKSNLVDRWMQAIMSLLPSNMPPASREVGIILLGVTAGNVGTVKLLEHYSSWGMALLELLRREDLVVVKGAVLEALGQIMDRLGPLVHLPGVRRDGAALANKMVLSIITHDLEDPACPSHLAAQKLLASILRSLPSAAKTSLPQLERLVTNSLSRACSTFDTKLAARAAQVLSALPAAAGDGGTTWVTYSRRLLLSTHLTLDTLTVGWIDPCEASALRSSLCLNQSPDPLIPPPKGSGSKGSTSRKIVLESLSLLAGLLDCLGQLLTSSFPSPVNIPIPAVLALTRRVLHADSQSAVSFLSGSPLLSEILPALPSLHIAAIRLLDLAFRAAASGAIPYLLARSRLLREQLRAISLGGQAALAAVTAAERGAVYESVTEALYSGGPAVARLLCQEVVGAVEVEMYGCGLGEGKDHAQSVGSGAPGREDGSRRSKKAKTGAAENMAAAADVALVTAGSGHATWPAGSAAILDLSAVKSALSMLSALVTGGCGVLPAAVRHRADALLAHASGVLAEGASVLRAGDVRPSGGSKGVLALKSMEAAGIEGLLASLLAPLPHRPSYCSQALQHGLAGRLSCHGPTAAAAYRMAVASEALLHPRSMPYHTAAVASQSQDLLLPRPRIWSFLAPEPQAFQGATPLLRHVPEPQPTPLTPHSTALATEPKVREVQSGSRSASEGAVDGDAGYDACSSGATRVRAAGVAGKVHGAELVLEVEAVEKQILAQSEAACMDIDMPGNQTSDHLDQYEMERVEQTSVRSTTAQAIGQPSTSRSLGLERSIGSQNATDVKATKIRVESGWTSRPTVGVPAKQPLALQEESGSDSEGPLPEIDSGGEEDEEGDEMDA